MLTDAERKLRELPAPRKTFERFCGPLVQR
jgi:hypothetical protein